MDLAVRTPICPRGIWSKRRRPHGEEKVSKRRPNLEAAAILALGFGTARPASNYQVPQERADYADCQTFPVAISGRQTKAQGLVDAEPRPESGEPSAPETRGSSQRITPTHMASI